MRVSEAQHVAACEVAAQVHQGQLRRVDGVRILADEHGINESSAGDFIEDYRRLAEGREFQRAMSGAAMRYFMEQVAVREGALGKANAIRALQAHIRYYEKDGKRTNVMRNVLAEFQGIRTEGIGNSIALNPDLVRARPVRVRRPVQVSFTQFCANLGAPLKVPRNSWCGYSTENRRAVFTLWADRLQNGRYLFWSTESKPHHTRPGAKEMRKIIDIVLSGGVDSFGIVCYAKDEAAITRERERYDSDVVLPLRFVQEPEGIVGYVTGEVKAEDVAAGRVWQVSAVQTALDDLEPPVGIATPDLVGQLGYGYRRDGAVREYVLSRSDGKCEYCGRIDFAKPNGMGYVETHHVLRLADQGPDTPSNVIALCSSHHREAHFGSRAAELEREFVRILAG
jgi:5-methylcytosine-specific restriction enzyme A